MNRQQAFTLLEVMVAVAILSLALMAAIRSTNVSIQTVEALQARLAADWVASNRLAEYRARGTWPELGERSGEASQAGVNLRWRERVAATPNSRFRRIEVAVFSVGGDQPLTTLTGFAVNRPR